MKNLENKNDHIEGLIHAYLSGIISYKEKDELFSWIVQNPDNVKYFNEISDIWLSASVFQETENFNENDAFNRVKEKISFVNTNLSPEKKVISFSWFKIAAILVPAMILSGLISRSLFPVAKEYSEKPFVFEVPYGSKASIVLPDNSKVVLNAGSKLTCSEGFGKTHRVLKLTGEGYFTVAKNKNLPFIVHAGNLDVKALGTEFNVKAYPEDAKIEAILIHGSIQIKKVLSKDANEKPVILMPKQSLVYTKQLDLMQIKVAVEKNEPAPALLPVNPANNVEVRKTTVDPAIYTTWKEGSWIIYQQELSDLAIELERKYDVNILFVDESLKRFKVTGTLPDISLEQVLAAIRLISPVEYKIKGKDVELLEDKNLTPLFNKYYKNTDAD